MHPMLNIAVKAARRAGSVIQRASHNIDIIRVEKKSANDFVTDVDRAAEQAIIDVILEAYPSHAILAEESGAKGMGASEYEWIIDPIDGTTNFLHGHSQYAISIALAHKGQVQEAVVYDPSRNDLYTASRGVGAFLNERRIRVSKRIQLNECLIATGFPVVDQSMIDTYLAILKDVIAKSAGARREGAASLDLCNVACGRVDGFFEFNLKPWDIAAGSLIVQEAGGIVTDMKGEQTWLESGDIVAASPKVLAQLLHIIAPHVA
ncbi:MULTISPECIES: inositol monophosphatase family protein [Craterilacuibacter]|uniref:Inositol-1-monophosphatase n=1 Tax=Craterilacuibacter sinensis TaxID=2686017 RepID=A0A845BSF6_9NEIS|nr:MULTISPECIES: inositol monophosphatase family protein [Craterilacuibacter]MCL6261905.1 inositol monophosphatase [Craterilacuibacter sp. RT1T]MXR35513.1 inositol monophosphatase [Craterilacuibacter sinensis]RQW28818.1 inositol monophosphatase [Rhodobacteraceae bacterium CH30]